jgi:hypothetical protein
MPKNGRLLKRALSLRRILSMKDLNVPLKLSFSIHQGKILWECALAIRAFFLITTSLRKRLP